MLNAGRYPNIAKPRFSSPGPRGGTTAGGMVFYEEQFETGQWAGLTQFLDAFNGASGGTIMLEAGARKGRRPVETVMDDVLGIVQRRNPSGTGTLTPKTFGDSEHAAIKIFRSAPMNLTRQDWVDKGLGDETGTRLFGEQVGAAQAQDYLNTVIAALVGAVTAVGASAIHNITGETVKTMNFGSMNTGLFKIGDRRQSLRSFVAHSKVMGDLVGTAFSSQVIAFQVGNTTIANGGIPSFGLQQIMTDASPLVNLNGSATDTYNTLALIPGAATVKTGPSGQQVAPITGTETAAPENIKTRLTLEWEYEIKIRGVSFTGSGDNPNNAALADAANWTLIASDNKLGPGVLFISQ
jgi:hypothetical protein